MTSRSSLALAYHALPVLAALACLTPTRADAITVLISRHNQSQLHTWDSNNPGVSTLLHSQQMNDADYNVAEGSTFGWYSEHFNDRFARFVVGSNVGFNSEYLLGQNGLAFYAYPKHISVHNNEIVVMSRNDGTLWRYTPGGAQLGSVKTSSNTGQGMASAGDDLYVSLWNGASSEFARYNAAFAVQATHTNPTGMGNFNNIVDFVHDAGSGHFFGLATTGEGGTGTNSTTVLEFEMGGAVIKSYPLPFACDGIGVFNATVCGDGKLEGGEACDDGNKVDTDACTNACKKAACGDAIVQAGVEDCDDGNQLDTDACISTCKLAACGDGFIQADVETCDDGNAADDDACTNACEPATCGDAIVQAGVESCDDGNDIDDDECSNMCVAASCGDGVVQPGETCDDPQDPECVDCMLVAGSTTDATSTTTDTSTSEALTTDITTTDTTTTDITTTDITTTASATTSTGTGGDSNSSDPTDTPTTTGVPDDSTTGVDPSSSSGSTGAGEAPIDDGGCGCRSHDTRDAGGLLAILTILGFTRPVRRRRR